MSVKDWPTPWKVEKSPQTNGTIGWSVLDADDNEIVTVWDEVIARLVARAGNLDLPHALVCRDPKCAKDHRIAAVMRLPDARSARLEEK